MPKYFDRGDYVLEITEHSPTERTKRLLPKPHTLGAGRGIVAPVVPSPQPKPEPRRIPSKLRRAANFARASAEHLAAGRPQATDEQVAARFATCEACPLFVRESEGAGVCSHPSCGCNLKRVGVAGLNKLRWADQACPIGRWTAVSPAPSP